MVRSNFDCTMIFLSFYFTLTHTSGALVDIDGIWVEELLPAAFEGAEYTYRWRRQPGQVRGERGGDLLFGQVL